MTKAKAKKDIEKAIELLYNVKKEYARGNDDTLYGMLSSAEFDTINPIHDRITGRK
jgi:hypothetical protein